MLTVWDGKDLKCPSRNDILRSNSRIVSKNVILRRKVDSVFDKKTGGVPITTAKNKSKSCQSKEI